MAPSSCNYSLFQKFIEKFSPEGYTGIDPGDPLIVELEEQTTAYDQFFLLADLIRIKIVYTSKRSMEMMGIPANDLNPYHFFEATHPEDIPRHGNGRSKMFNMANDLYIAERGRCMLSTNLRISNRNGNYPDHLFQLFLFYSTIPHKSVFLLQVLTNIESFKKRRDGFHYYVGNDLSHFRYPDEDLLKMGHPFSAREFEIIKLIKMGLSSVQIGEKLFLSVHTVNTHRKNIISKSCKKSIHDLIDDLVDQRLL